jgi:tyrosyl-tRNA synthetase
MGLPTGRWIATRVLAKRDDAAGRWEQRAQKIADGELPNLWDTFNERGYVKDVAG